MSQNRTAIVVDDEPITRLDLSQLLGELGFAVVGEAADGFDAIELCRRHRPDVVLMDIKMPVFDGMTASETIIAEDLCGCVVLLTAFQDRELIDRAGRIGVTGYLVKPVEERLLLPTLEVAMAQAARLREAPSPAGTEIAWGPLRLDAAARAASAPGGQVRLTPTECAILKLLMGSPGQVITKSLLLDRIALDTPDCTETSLKMHVSNLRRKLREAGAGDCIEAVWGIGFRLRDPEEDR